MPIKHAFVNPHADGTDSTLTRPSDWNANHTGSLTQAQSHDSPDTDSAPTALHHTLGIGANQALAGNTHIPVDPVNADWLAVSGLAQILNKPILAQSMTNVLHKWLNSYNATTGAFTQTQPDYSDLTNLPVLAQTSAAAANKFLTAYDATTGLFTNAQPDWSNLTNIPSTFPIATPGTLTVSSTNVATGAHTHAITSSSNPGAAAAILATSINGTLRLSTTLIGTTPFYCSTNCVVSASDSSSNVACTFVSQQSVNTGITNTGSFDGVLAYSLSTGAGTGTLGSVRGGFFIGESDAIFAGTITNLRGVETYCTMSSGTATTGVSLYVRGPDVSGSGVITNKYGIYQVTTGISNYFASAANFNAGLNIAGGTVYTSISSNPGAAAAILATDGSGNLTVQNFTAAGTTDSNSTTTGALQAAGGLGVAKNVVIGGKLGITVNPAYAIDGQQPSGADRNLLRFGITGVTNGLTVQYINASTTLSVSLDGGAAFGAATGGFKGVGTLNVAGDIYKNGTAYTNPAYVLEHWATGEIVKHADKAGAIGYKRPTLAECESYIRKHYELPGHLDNFGLFDGSEWLLEKVEELATYVIELSHEVERLRGN